MKTDNELIAEFDGWTKDDHLQNYYRHNKQNGFRGMPIGCLYQNMMYDSSLDWLMPVVEKIKDGKYKNEAYGQVHFHLTATGFQARWNCSILGSLTYQIPLDKEQHTFKTIDIPHISIYNEDSFKENTPIACTYKAVVEFIKWYNSQNS